MVRNDSPLAVFITCALSHIAMFPTIVQLWKRRWMWEVATLSTSMFVSFMYHTCQALNTSLFLSELQWHRLDNIFAITAFSQLFTYMANIHNPLIEFIIKVSGLMIAIVLQEKDPWNVAYTVVPIVCYGALPALGLCTFNRKEKSMYDAKNLVFGLGFFCIAVPFFILGLDDENDPYRMFHGMWHVVGSTAAFYLWRMVKNPAAIQLQTIMIREGMALLKAHQRALLNNRSPMAWVTGAASGVGVAGGGGGERGV